MVRCALAAHQTHLKERNNECEHENECECKQEMNSLFVTSFKMEPCDLVLLFDRMKS